jgi:tetratricopeptide (TPR) repeat protein
MVLLPHNQARADCITDPTYSCLLESSLKLAHEARRAVANKYSNDIERSVASDNIEIVIRQIASVYAMAGDLNTAAETAAELGAAQLSYFVQDDLLKYPPGDADLSPIRNAADAILASTAELESTSKTLETEAAAIIVLAKVGAAVKAQSALNDAVRRFGEAVSAGNTEILGASYQLMVAAVAFKDLASAREIVRIISKEGMDKRGISKEWPGWTNEVARGDLGRALAETGDIAGAEKIAQSLDEGIRSTILGEIEKFHSKSDNPKSDSIAETIERIRGLPNGDSAVSHDPTIWLLTGQLIERKQLTEAAALADEMLDTGWGDNIRIGIALAYISNGDMTSAEALMEKITDTGRAVVLIRHAQMRARRGEAEKARKLLDDAYTVLAVEKNPARLVDWHVIIALTLIELRDSDGAVTAIDVALQNLEGIGDPMQQAEYASRLAAVQLKLGRPEDAVATLDRSGMGALDGLLMSAGFLATEGFSGDAIASVALALKKLPPRESIDGLDDLAAFYAEAARVLVPASHGN